MATVVFLVQREVCDPLRTVRRKVLFPIETATAAALVAQRGHRIVAFDLNLRADGEQWQPEFEAVLREHQPSLVVSAPQTLTFLVTEDRKDTAWAFAAAKRWSATVRTVYVGAYATSAPEQALEESGADWVIRGEYDEAIAALVDRGTEAAVSPVAGLATRGAQAAEVPPAQVADLNQLPFPAYRAFGLERYFEHRGKGNLRYAAHSERYTHYMSSRGCTLRCCFCNVSHLRAGRRYRRRSVPMVLDDLERLRTEHQIEEVHFLDENLNLDRRRMAALCDGLIERQLGLSWFAAGGMSIYPLDELMLGKMREAGCYRLHLAIESGSERVLREIIHKPIRLDRARLILEQARAMDYEVVGYFVIGLPGESRAELEQTLELASHWAFDYVTLAIATPLAGTELAEQCRREGLLVDPVELADVSRRARAVVATGSRTRRELEELRWRRWDQLNFGATERQVRVQRLLGVSADELERIRAVTERGFRARWGQATETDGGPEREQASENAVEDWLRSDGVIALAPLTEADLAQNLRWMQDRELRRLLEVSAAPKTMDDQRAWYDAAEADPSRHTLKILTIDGDRPRYVGNVMLFDIDTAAAEAEVALFLGEPSERGRGLGRRAIVALVSWARERYGPLALRIKALRDNAPAIRLYRRLGFHEDRRSKRQRTEDPLRIHLRLESDEQLEAE